MRVEVEDSYAEEFKIDNITLALVRPDMVLIANEWQGTAKVVDEQDFAEVLSAWLRDI
jgi:hypothetical protein